MTNLDVMSDITYHLCIIKVQVYNMIPNVSKNHSNSNVIQDDVEKGNFLLDKLKNVSLNFITKFGIQIFKH